MGHKKPRITEFIKQVQEVQKDTTEKILMKETDLAALIWTSLDIFESFLKVTSKEQNEELAALQELVSRVYTSLKALILLSLSGFAFPALSFLREIVEAEYLMTYFMQEPDEFERWWRSDRQTRNKKYGPRVLREKIAGNDINLKNKLDADYMVHSDLLTHMSPSSLKLQKGFKTKSSDLYYDSTLIKISLSEIAFHTVSIAEIVAALGKVLTNDEAFLSSLKRLTKLKKDLKYYQLISAVLLKDRLEHGENKYKV